MTKRAKKHCYPDGERFAILMRLRDGELHYSALRLRLDVIDDAETAIEQLQAGKTIWVLQHGPLCTTVQQAFRNAA